MLQKSAENSELAIESCDNKDHIDGMTMKINAQLHYGCSVKMKHHTEDWRQRIEQLINQTQENASE